MEILTRRKFCAYIAEKYGYKFVQENGEVIMGPPSGGLPPMIPPPPGCEVFVANIPTHYTVCDLAPLFLTAGLIYTLRFKVNFCGECRGYAFVKYCNPQSVSKAIVTLDNVEIDNRVKLRVRRSVDNRRLNLEVDRIVDCHQLYKLLHDELDNLQFIKLFKLDNHFVYHMVFANHHATCQARKKLVVSEIVKLIFPTKRVLNWALPENESNEMEYKNLFLSNLPLTLEESDLTKLVAARIDPIFMFQLKKIHHYAFVYFKSKYAATYSLRRLHNFKISDDCVIKATWAFKKPRKPKQIDVNNNDT